MQKIGVIVPVYKVEKYIAECIESILAQTYTNFRLILVDDGTPDNAGKICDEYAKKDSRITVIHQENAGVTRARARGVEEATDCEWITFIDSDDTITIDALEHLISYTNEETDIVHARMSRFHSAEKGIAKGSRSKTISAKQHRINMILGIDSGPTAKIYRRNLFTNDVFEIQRSIVMGEDTISNTRIAFKNHKNVISSNYIVYNYRQHEESCMHTFNGCYEYEERFLEQLINSIPNNELYKYQKYIIIRKIKTFDFKFGYSAQVPEWYGNRFHKQLINEIKQYNIKELFFERKLLNATNDKKRKFLILMKRIKNKFFGQNTLL